MIIENGFVCLITTTGGGLHNGIPVTNGITSDSTRLVADIAGMIGSKFVLRIEKDKEFEELEISVE